MTENFTTGYVPLGATFPSMYPQSIYGTEVFELNLALRELAYGYASKAKLNDSSAAMAYRKHYHVSSYANSPPSIRKCDTATSDAYFSGSLLGYVRLQRRPIRTNYADNYC